MSLVLAIILIVAAAGLGFVTGALVGRNNADEVEAVVDRYEEAIAEIEAGYDQMKGRLENEINRLQGRVEAAEAKKTKTAAKRAAS